MVALNFSPQFSATVAAGIKRQTIRRDTQARPGDRLQLFSGQRTKRCVKLVASDPVCSSVETVMMFPEFAVVAGMHTAGVALEKFARDDGFLDYREMWAWFKARYQVEEFAGVLIKWKSWAEVRDAE